MMKELFTRNCRDCHKIFRTDKEDAKICPSCQDERDFVKGGDRIYIKHKRKKPKLSIGEVMHIGAVCDKVNGTSLSVHYDAIVKRIENTNVDRCVCCGEIIPEGRMVCITCEKAGE
jgi:RNA polymerase subunit RPABC4/transcription elongation factor Spt4